MTRPSGLVIWESGGKLSVFLEVLSVNHETTLAWKASIPCHHLLLADDPDRAIMWLGDGGVDDVSLSEGEAQDRRKEQRKQKGSKSEHRRWVSGEAGMVGEGLSRRTCRMSVT